MKTSRAPVQAALRILEEEGLIRRFDGRGYLVGGPNSKDEPIRARSREARPSDLRTRSTAPCKTAGLWERVYDEVEAAVAASLIFGDFRIIELELGDYYGVSRTVVRDVLSRLHERGLITKTASSHWVASALTAQSVRERFELRGLMEPEAIRRAADRTDYDKIAEALRQARERDPATRDARELGRPRPRSDDSLPHARPERASDRADPAESPAPRRRFARADQARLAGGRQRGRRISCSLRADRGPGDRSGGDLLAQPSRSVSRRKILRG